MQRVSRGQERVREEARRQPAPGATRRAEAALGQGARLEPLPGLRGGEVEKRAAMPRLRVRSGRRPVRTPTDALTIRAKVARGRAKTGVSMPEVVRMRQDDPRRLAAYIRSLEERVDELEEELRLVNDILELQTRRLDLLEETEVVPAG